MINKKSVMKFMPYLLLLSAMVKPALAGVNSDLSSYFDDLGFQSNVTNPSVYNGQAAGYYSGGSVFTRDAVRDVQIAQIDLPSYRAGCGGIDMFTGGFSFVNSDQLVSMSKNVLNNAVGYAFNLAMETATPEIANTMKYIQDLANKVNQASMNSCETAAGLVGSAWPKTQQSQKAVCASIGTGQGIFDDMASARQECGAGGQMSTTMASANGAFKNLVLDNGNLAWKAIQQNSFLQKDTELAQLFLSLSGSVILRKNGTGDDATNTFTLLPSLATNDSLLKGLLHGGQVNIYKCDTTESDGCLNPSAYSLTISPENSLQGQVNVLLDDMVNKIYTDEKLTAEEIGLLNSTRIPVYKILNVQSAFAQDKSILNVSEYSDVIATDILFQYLSESLSIVKTSSGTLQYPPDIMQQFQEGIDKARVAVQALQKNAYSQMAMSNQLVQQTQTIEQMLAGQLSTQLGNTISWANGIK